ncbi:MAG: hypothetical protein M0Z71_00125 [Nitrospiraceae bacterium]|nr:hypothetical protein [Nitrospiraceae bacterium]
MRTISLILLLVLLAGLVPGAMPVHAAGGGAVLDDAPGNSIVDALKSFAKGGWGKALFFCSLITGVICLLFTRHRHFGLISLVFGILLGIFGGLGDSLWSLFTSWDGGN